MNFQESLSYLYGLGNEVVTMKLGLENIRALLKGLGNPHDKFRRIQIAGTNGKGSTCAFLESIFLEAGLKVGLMTSPHLVSITERVRIDGKDIDEERFARFATVVREAGEKLARKSDGELTVPTFFEQITAISALAFADAGVEWAILETGLGGRLDATTALDAEIAAITRIDFDHQEYLGETIEQIASEKAAIIREGVRAVVGEQRAHALKVILDRCTDVGVAPVRADEMVAKSSQSADPFEGDALSVKTRLRHYDVESLGLVGKHQAENATVALLVAELVGIGEGAIGSGLSKARHRGRLERVGGVLLDGAHNESGARALAEFLSRFEDRTVTMVYGAMRDKDLSKIAPILFPKVKHLVTVKADSPRALSASEIASEAFEAMSADRVFESASLAEALATARELAGTEGTVCVTGSLYLVGEARKMLSA